MGRSATRVRENFREYQITIRYDNRCYFNMRSQEKLRSKKQICTEILVNSPVNPWRRKGRLW